MGDITFREVLSFKQTDMMKHAWGYHSREPGYRTHYCTQLDDKNMVHMVKEGFFEGPQHVGNVGAGLGMYYLTEKGVQFLKEAQKEEAKIKRSLK